jgi:hypothetical protein
MSGEVTQRSGWKCLFESAQPSHSFGIPGSSDSREASEARFLLLALLFLECRDLPLNGLRGCNALLARRPTTAVLHHGGARMMSHWVVLKRCAARALLLARHKESKAGDAAHVFEDNGSLTQETIVTSNEWKKSLFRTLCASTRIWPVTLNSKGLAMIG